MKLTIRVWVPQETAYVFGDLVDANTEYARLCREYPENKYEIRIIEEGDDE
jgi:hypothetical protein